jgi:tellurite resistance protein TerC
VIYVFGVFLIVSAARMLVVEEDHLEPEKSVFLRLLERIMPLHDGFVSHQFFTRIDGRLFATRLAVVLMLVESSDLIFAIDSIPAILAISTEPFIVVTSNVFAILGLRSLYFAIAPMLERFRYLKLSLVFLLGFVGVKMLVAKHTDISPVATLSAILGIIAVGALASIVTPPRIPMPSYLSDSERLQLSSMSPRAARRIAGLITMSGAFLVATTAVMLPRLGLPLFCAAVLFLIVGSFWARRLIRNHTPPAPEEDGPTAPGAEQQSRP